MLSEIGPTCCNCFKKLWERRSLRRLGRLFSRAERQQEQVRAICRVCDHFVSSIALLYHDPFQFCSPRQSELMISVNINSKICALPFALTHLSSSCHLALCEQLPLSHVQDRSASSRMKWERKESISMAGTFQQFQARSSRQSFIFVTFQLGIRAGHKQMSLQAFDGSLCLLIPTLSATSILFSYFSLAFSTSFPFCKGEGSSCLWLPLLICGDG